MILRWFLEYPCNMQDYESLAEEAPLVRQLGEEVNVMSGFILGRPGVLLVKFVCFM